MPDLIFSYLAKRRHGKPNGLRIYSDGAVEAYRDSRLVKSSAGNYEDTPITPDWYPATTLDAGQLEQAKQAIEVSGVRELPSTVTGTNNSTDPATGELEVMTDEGLHKITVRPWFPGGDVGQRLFNLVTQLNNLITQALA